MSPDNRKLAVTSCYMRCTKKSLFLVIKKPNQSAYIYPYDSCFAVSKGPDRINLALEVNGTGYATSRSCDFEFSNSVVSSEWENSCCPTPDSHHKGHVTLWTLWTLWTHDLVIFWSSPSFFQRTPRLSRRKWFAKMANKGNSVCWHSLRATLNLDLTLPQWENNAFHGSLGKAVPLLLWDS